MLRNQEKKVVKPKFGLPERKKSGKGGSSLEKQKLIETENFEGEPVLEDETANGDLRKVELDITPLDESSQKISD